MLKLRVLLIKEVADEAEAQTLYDQIKVLIAPKEPIAKEGRIIENTELN